MSHDYCMVDAVETSCSHPKFQKLVKCGEFSHSLGSINAAFAPSSFSSIDDAMDELLACSYDEQQ